MDYSLLEPVVLTGSDLSMEEVEQIARGRRVVIDDEVAARCESSRQVIEQAVAGLEVAYGISTGFGNLANKHIGHEQLRDLQRNLILSHSSGVGEYMPDEVARAMMALRINALAKGFSGCRYQLLEALQALLQAGICPRIPSHGSVGASGDLAPLSHMSLALIGEGEVSYKGKIMAAAAALELAGLKPVVLEAKEGLALINGTQFMNAVGSLAMRRAWRVIQAADIIGAMSVEGMLGTIANTHPMVGKLRAHAGQQAVARNIRRLTANSKLVASHKNCSRVQDAYSLRCLPQVHGATREGWNFAASIMEREMNSVTDNPLVVPSQFLSPEELSEHPRGMVVSAGNFHGAPLALALDTAAVAMCYLGTISERRCDKLLSGGDGLPEFLTPQPGVQSGYMIVQYAAASLVNENKVFAHPASVDTIPTSAGKEDHNSHGPTAAHKLTSIVGNLEKILACEFICAAQALEVRRPLAFGPGTEAALTCLRQEVAPLTQDRPPYLDIRAAVNLIANGNLIEAVEKAVGQLE